MSTEQILHQRSASKCELCGANTDLSVYGVGPNRAASADNCALLCGVCMGQMDPAEPLLDNHWRCLNDSMWSEVSAVRVLAWRMLQRLHEQVWARDLLDMLYLEEEDMAWAQAGQPQAGPDESLLQHVDSNGAVLAAGDTVTLIKDLVVKGGGFTAKRGTAVRGISLDAGNAEHIEGRVNGQKIVILTQFVKKS